MRAAIQVKRKSDAKSLSSHLLSVSYRDSDFRPTPNGQLQELPRRLAAGWQRLLRWQDAEPRRPPRRRRRHRVGGGGLPPAAAARPRRRGRTGASRASRRWSLACAALAAGARLRHPAGQPPHLHAQPRGGRRSRAAAAAAIARARRAPAVATGLACGARRRPATSLLDWLGRDGSTPIGLMALWPLLGGLLLLGHRPVRRRLAAVLEAGGVHPRRTPSRSRGSC